MRLFSLFTRCSFTIFLGLRSGFVYNFLVLSRAICRKIFLFSLGSFFVRCAFNALGSVSARYFPNDRVKIGRTASCGHGPPLTNKVIFCFCGCSTVKSTFCLNKSAKVLFYMVEVCGKVCEKWLYIFCIVSQSVDMTRSQISLREDINRFIHSCEGSVFCVLPTSVPLSRT